MIRAPFNDGWEFRSRVSPFAELGGAAAPYQPVPLPHALPAQQGSPRAPHG